MIMNWTKNRPKVAKKLQLCMGSILVFNLNGLKFNIDPNFSKKMRCTNFYNHPMIWTGYFGK